MTQEALATPQNITQLKRLRYTTATIRKMGWKPGKNDAGIATLEP